MRCKIRPITKEVLNRFSGYLEIFKENCESKQFSWSELAYGYRVPINVTQALVDLKYAKRIDVGIYKPLYKIVEPYMARRVCERIIEIQNNYRDNMEKRLIEDTAARIETQRAVKGQTDKYGYFNKPFVYENMLELRAQIIRYLDTPLAANWKDLTVTSKREWLQEGGKRPEIWRPKNCSEENEPLFFRNTVSLFEVWVECLGQKVRTFRRPSSYGKDLTQLKRDVVLTIGLLKDWAQVDGRFVETLPVLQNGITRRSLGEIFVRMASTHDLPNTSVLSPSYKNGLDRITQTERGLIENGKNADAYQKNYERIFKENLSLKNKIDELEGLREKSTLDSKPIKKSETLFLKKLAESGVVALEIDYTQGKCETLRIEDIQISMSPNQ